MRFMTLIAAVTLTPGLAFAEGFDYNYLEAGYVSSEIDAGGVDIDGNGLSIRGSWELQNNFQIVGSYTAQDYDGGIDVSVFQIGGGWHKPLSEKMDLITSLTWIATEVNNIDDNGLGIEIGLRGMAAPKVELEAALQYADVGNADTAFRIDGRYHFTPNFAAGAGATFDDDVTTLRIGVRYTFGGGI